VVVYTSPAIFPGPAGRGRHEHDTTVAELDMREDIDKWAQVAMSAGIKPE
jgi:hypothetical protein